MFDIRCTIPGMKDFSDAIVEEKHFRYILEKFETSEDPIAVELRAKIMESARNCPYDSETCPYIHPLENQSWDFYIDIIIYFLYTFHYE